MALEPLLKEEEEKIVFRNNKNNSPKKFKFNKSVIMTIIFTVVVLYIFWGTANRFYLGFKYYDINNEDDTKVEVIVEKNIAIDSKVTEIYNKIQLDSRPNSISLLKRFYSKSLLTTELTINERIELVLKNIFKNDCVTNMLITKKDFNDLAISLINDSNLINEITTSEANYGAFIVRYDSVNEAFVVTQNNCEYDQNFVIKEIEKASSKGDEIYIYEKYGYFVQNIDNTYNLYGDFMNSQLLASNLNIANSTDFTDKNLLKTYKWTFKKGSNDNYYFYSIAQIDS